MAFRLKSLISIMPVSQMTRLLIFGLCILLTACTTTNQKSIFENQDASAFVKLTEIESNAPLNDHPATVSPETLLQWLLSLELAGNTIIDETSKVFTTPEAKELITPLATALNKATPGQDVIFQSSGQHGILGDFSGKTITLGRVFVSDGKLNLIFGAMHKNRDPRSSMPEPDEKPGSRSSNVKPAWNLIPGMGQLPGTRQDWVVFNIQPENRFADSPAPAPAKAESVVKPTKAIPHRLQEIEERLMMLNQLFKKGLITEQEYKEKRQVILGEL